MARTFALAAYAIKVWNLEEKEYEQVSNFSEGSDLLDVLVKFFTQLAKKASRDKAAQQIVRALKVKTDIDARRIYGVIETGEYGYESDLFDVESEKVVHKRKSTEAVMFPFYFMADIQDGTDEAIIVIQRTANLGIRQLLYQMLTTKFDQDFDDCSLRFLPLVEEKEVEKYQKGAIEKIRFISLNITKDITDAFDKGHQEKPGYMEIVVHAKRGSSLPIQNRLRQFFSGQKPLGTLIALDENNFKYQDIKVTSRVGGSRRTVDLAKLRKLRSYHDISDIALDGNTGHPKFQAIHERAEALVNKIKKQIGIPE
jgi:hypothetical protein